MAIRQVGGAPVYVIDVQVPKVTDARGKSYGTLVSDLRWKLWEEVQNSQLQQMKFEQMSRQAQLDVLEQKQRDISRAIRDARELQSQIKADVTRGTAPARGFTETTRKPATDPYTGEPTGAFIETTKTRTPIGDVAGTGVFVESPESVAARKGELEKYIQSLESQQTQLGEEFGRFTSAPPQDILSRTREAFQTQIGEGGFGISRRPFRELPRFDEAQAVGRVQDTIAREEQALIDAAIKRKRDNINNRIAEISSLEQNAETEKLLADLNQQLDEPLTLEQERRAKEIARQKLTEQMTAAGAEPTSRAGFLMKDFPTPGPLPIEETRVPTGRYRDMFSPEGSGISAPIDREALVIADLTNAINAGDTAAAEVYSQELEDIRATKNAPVNEPTSLPAAQLRALELDALGVAAEEQQTRGARPVNRGFTYPVEQMGGGFGATTTFGRPGGILDRLNVATRRGTGGTVEIVDPDTGEPIDMSPEPVEELNFGGGVVPAEQEEVPQASLKPTIQSRRDRYSMKTIKKGLELADKPKQLARLAKTNDPSSAPEYVQLVNKVFQLNSARPDRFKLSFDEIARAYKDDPSTREKAHSYLVAIDAVESNITKPT